MREISRSRVPPQTPSYVSEVLKYVPAHSDSSKYDSICHISEGNELCSSFRHVHEKVYPTFGSCTSVQLLLNSQTFLLRRHAQSSQSKMKWL